MEIKSESGDQETSANGQGGGVTDVTTVGRRRALAVIAMAGAFLGGSAAVATKAAADPPDGSADRRQNPLAGGDSLVVASQAQVRTATTSPGIFFLSDKGMEGPFVLDAADTTSADNGGTVLVTAAGARYRRVIPASGVSVRWFGAKGDDSSDDTAAINAADTAAKLASTSVDFPAGTYLGYLLKPTVGWHSASNAVIKNNNPAGDRHQFVHADKVRDITFEGLTFDGSVSADPATWSNATYDAFTGAISFHLSSSQRVIFQNCIFRNSRQSNVRITGSSDILLANCSMIKARGNFGDGIFAGFDCSRIKHYRCSASDYTRIGFVADSGCSDISYVECFAENGHHASRLYGGGENNAAIWVEQTNYATISRCVSRDNPDYGFRIEAFGSATPLTPDPVVQLIEGCVSINSESGYCVGNAAGHPVFATCRDNIFYAKDAHDGSWGYTVISSNSRDSFLFSNCYSALTGQARFWTATFLIAVRDAQASPTVTIKDSIVDWRTQRSTDLLSPTVQYADVFVNNPTLAKISIEAVQSSSVAGTVVKSVGAGGTSLRLAGMKLTIPAVNGFKRIDIDASVLESNAHGLGGATTAGDVKVANSEIRGPVSIQTAGRCDIQSSRIDLAGSGQVSITRRSAAVGIDTKFESCHITKNVTAGGAALKVTDAGAAPSIVALMGCVLINAGHVETSVEPFVWLPTAGSSGKFAGCFGDSSVVSALKIGGTLSTPAGVEALDF